MARKIVTLKDRNNNELFLLAFPIGSIYMSVNSTNPKKFFGGEWELWGKGRTPVCVDPNQEEFKNVEQLGGEKKHTLTVSEMPSHSHGIQVGWTTGDTDSIFYNRNNATNSLGTHNRGGDQPHNNLQPYITCYMWKRIA